MPGPLLLGLDLGGGGIRCLVVDSDGGACTSASRPLIARPQPDAPMSAVFAPEEVWGGLREAVGEALASAGSAPDAVAGIASTSMRHASALLDADGHALALTSNRDARGLATMLELATENGAEWHRQTGHWPHPVQPAGRLRWIQREAPQLAERVVSALALSDWLAFRLCGERATDPTQACESLVFEIASATWAPDLIQRLGIPAAWFPPVRASGSRLGSLSATAAAELGLRAGTPVAVGGADTQCALLAAGVITPG
ncbi:MAG: hypothetical protein E4H11_04430, partial [Myxococcales bacterium]